LNEPVRYFTLKEAIEVTAKRFPYFSVTLGHGLFWNYLEYIEKLPLLHPEGKEVCTPFSLRSRNSPLYRIIVHRNRLSVEFIHILTDGSGALEYLKSLLFNYFALAGYAINETEGIIKPSDPLRSEEYEDGYGRFFRKLPPPDKLNNAWHLPFKRNQGGQLRVTRIRMESDIVAGVARTFKSSVTEYLVSVYLFSLQGIYLAEKKNGKRMRRYNLRVEVPVNMRKKLPSVTMRNFSLFIMPGIDMRLGEYTFEEILLIARNSLQSESNLKQIGRFLSSNVSYEKNPIVRFLPLVIKRMAISAIYRGLGQKKFTGILTNMGAVKMPGWMEDLVESLEIIPPPPNRKVKISCGVISLNNRMVMSFLNSTTSLQFEIAFIKHLTQAGIRVTLLNE